MRKFFRPALCLLVLTASMNLVAQKSSYKFESVPDDPMNTRIYTLDNGLKVYLTVYRESPRIQTAIAVRTGSKNDPSDNTGMSHYLEHMMFKGTTHFGTSDYEKEAPLLARIEELFEVYRKTTDPEKRAEIYKLIDEASAEAAKYAIANEYDKLLSVIGAKGTNAFTSNEQTVYINDIPANQVENWLKIESDRFANPVFRIFHTELETVYEEKNMSLDRDGDKLWENLYAGLFQKHPYGTQTTIGTIEHLKNPSLKKLKEYYNQRYVPNNMALIMSGDFNPDSAIRLIDKYFSVLREKRVQPFVSPSEAPINNPVVRDVVGPDAESVAIGFRFGGIHTADANLLNMASQVLSNGKVGLIDINLKLAQKVLSATAGPEVMADYSTLVLTGKPKEGQTLEEVKKLLLDQVDLLKTGKFDDWMLPAIINNMKLSRIRQLESNMARAMNLADVFVTEQPYAEYVKEIDALSKITKQQVADFAARNFKDNYVVVYKRTGEDQNVQKVTKPQITPVQMRRDIESRFYTDLVSFPVAPIKPKFLDYTTDIKRSTLRNNIIEVLYVPNTENKLFSLYYYFAMGSQNDPAIALAVNYLSYLGTSKYSAEKLKEELFKLGCSFSVSVSNDEMYVNLTGLFENMVPAMKLLDELMRDAQPDQAALNNLVSDIIKSRSDNKLNKNVIRQALTMYGAYGPSSAFTDIIPESVLKTYTGKEMVSLIHNLNSYKHNILYYGPATNDQPTGMRPDPSTIIDFISILERNHTTPADLKEVPDRKTYPQLPTEEGKVYMVDYDMKQVDIVFHARSDKFDPGKMPVYRMFNEYFGSGMNSIVFQEIREAKALAYSSSAAYRTPSYPDEFNTISAFVGTQNDKMPEAIEAMFNLFNDMPQSEKSFAAAREGILNQIGSERITKTRILFNYINAKKFGFDHDTRKDVFDHVPLMKIDAIKEFQQKYLAKKNFTILLVGHTKTLDSNFLQKFGKVETLNLEDIFGY
jgi:predicted Zn-dependent peptidase